LRKFFLAPGLAPAIAFLAPALLSVYFTFVINDFNRGLVWDSAHYVLSSQSLLKWLSDCLHHHYVSPATIDLGPSVMVDGPVLPAFGAALIGLGQIVHLPAEQSILMGQSMVCGLNSLLLYFLALRLVERKLALAGALIFGLNPASIVSASQFLTEQLTATTLLSLTLALSLALPRGKLDNPYPPNILQYAAWVVSGGLALLVLHLKTALFPTVALILFLAMISRSGPIKRKTKIVSALALGFFVCLIPWLIFSKLASGRISLAPNRVPSINLAVGMDLESDAWGVAPPTESVLPIIFDKPSAIAASLWLANPVGMTSLFLRKVERLFAYSWNDFGWPVLGLTVYWQCLVQRLLLAGAMLGTIYLLLLEKLLKNTLSSLNNKNFLKVAILLMVAGHFIFVPFETQPRYGYSALPYLVVLTLIAFEQLLRAKVFPYLYAIGSVTLILLASTDISGTLVALTGSIETALVLKDLIVALCFGLTLTAAYYLAAHPGLRGKIVVTLCCTLMAFALLVFKRQHLPPPEWSCTLPAGTKAERQIVLPLALARQWILNDQTMQTWEAALIDGDDNLQDAVVTINGQPAQGFPIPLLDVELAYPFQSTIKELAKMAAATRGQEPGRLRQWRIVQLPRGTVNYGGPNILTVEAAQQKDLKIYGQYRCHGPLDKRLWLPSMYGFSALRLSILGDSRTTDSLRRRAAQSRSLYNGLDSADLSPDQPGLQNGDYRIYLILGCSGPSSTSAHKLLPQGGKRPSITFRDYFVQVF
jgi:4-amino-4-deoxy-L-arabinose transferase-like glycosyltransferase